MSAETKKEQLAIGTLGEQFVAHWLQQNGSHIIAQGWHSRWGELDIVTRQKSDDNLLVFIEVKTRSRGNWDADGLLAITGAKQAKLWKTARAFLAQHPHFAELPCRFDVALVRCVRSPKSTLSAPSQTPSELNRTFPASIAINQPVTINPYTLTLAEYIESAFVS